MASGDRQSPDVIPDPEPEADLPLVTRSTVLRLNDGKEKAFPSRQDYVDQLVSQGIVTDARDLISNYSHLIGELFINWVSTGQVGCLFAVKLARKPRENRWVPIVQLNALSHGAELPEILNRQLDAVAEHHEAAVLVFPDIDTDADVVGLVNHLCAGQSGRWYHTDVLKSEVATTRLITLRWVLPSGKSVNYVLGFADLESMAPTRRGPYTALFLRIKDYKRAEPVEYENGRVVVHLADLDSTFTPQKWHDIVWEKTKEMKALFLPPESKFAARAKITFAVAAAACESLCAPTAMQRETDETVVK